MIYQVTSVDKFHGLNSHVSELELPDGVTTAKQMGAVLRAARLLMPGQSVAVMRTPADGTIIVFPNNAPGLTTGLHSLTLHPSLGCEPSR